MMGRIAYAEEWERKDGYGHLATTRKRKRGCKCAVACQRSFRCTTCKLWWSWCVGGSDDERCADCWAAKKPKEAAP